MVKVISDSTCDLSKEILDRLNIDIIPLHILLNDDEYEDGVNITPDEIYSWSDANKVTPKTSAPSIDRAIEKMEPYIKKGDEIICFTISGEMSTSANVMEIAAGELEAEDRVFVIDSRNLSTGIGLLVVEAAIMANQGLTGSEIKNNIEKLIPRVRASFVVDTLEYLHRGGRCSSVSALIGGALKLHPKIVVSDGKMGVAKKYRGKMHTVVMDYAKDMESELKSAKQDRVFITHSGCSDEIVSSVKQYLEGLNCFEEICITRAGGVISSHCGYGTLGVLFISQ